MAAEDISADWIRPNLGIPGVAVLSTTRVGGVSRGAFSGLNVGDHVGDSDHAVGENRIRLARQLPMDSQITWLKQVHGTHVIHAPTEYYPGVEADAVWTDRAGYACTIMSADCLPLVLADSDGRCVAAIHGGWRGLAAGIIRSTIAALPADPGRLVAWLGPAIGPLAFEVGDDVLAAFFLSDDDEAVQSVSHVPGKYNLNLTTIAQRQLLACGVDAGNISGGDLCTFSDAQRFYSFRRDGQTGRMATLILVR